MHLSSLPGPHGIGDLGTGAWQFLEFLAEAEQSLWQVCPINPTQSVHDHSPYTAPSAFAGNPLFVDLTALADRGYLDETSLEDPPGDPRHVEYDRVETFKRERLHTAFETFEATADDDERAAFEAFRERESDWLGEYALFAALKEQHDHQPWPEWPADLAHRDSDALAAARDSHTERIRYHAFVQWLFDEQWRELRAEATERGIDFIGDLPIYVAWDSADIWANPELFELTSAGEPAAVAGVPPTPGDEGQAWGMPVYDWDAIAATDYEWWIDRLERLYSLVDVVRIDHFKAFDEYWAVPAETDDVSAGEWRPGPDAAFFETVRAELGELPFIAEDLGFMDESMFALRDRFDLPGMRVAQYADWCQPGHMYKPITYPENCAAYTSTHDTDTTVGFYESMSAEQRECLIEALATDGESIAWDLIEAVWNSDANVAMTTVQDLLELGSEARFNTPGSREGNWTWRVTAEELDDELAGRLAAVTRATLR